MKNKSIMLFIFSTLIPTSIFAQMVPNTSVIRTPYGNVQNTTWHSVGQPYNFGRSDTTFPYLLPGDFTVLMKSDSLFSGKMNLTFDSINTLFLERREKKGRDLIIKPSDTKQIQHANNGKMYIGIPADSCWLFKTIPGLINSYAPLPWANTEYIIAVQKGDGPIVPMTKENLYKMIDDPKLRKTIEKGKLYQAVWKYNGSK